MHPTDYVDLMADADAGCYQWAGWHRPTGKKNEIRPDGPEKGEKGTHDE